MRSWGQGQCEIAPTIGFTKIPENPTRLILPMGVAIQLLGDR